MILDDVCMYMCVCVCEIVNTVENKKKMVYRKNKKAKTKIYIVDIYHAVDTTGFSIVVAKAAD